MLSERDLERISFIAQNGAEGQEVCALEICVAAVPEMVAEIRRLQHGAVKSEETERERGEDIGRVQRAVYDELCAGMTALGLDPAHIDGAGSDGDEAAMTGAEVAQFVDAATDMVDELRQERDAARAELAHAREVVGYYKRLFHDVVASLPHSRDWLDPDTESAMRAIVQGANAVRRCVYCGAGEEVDLRPYGPNGGDVCFPCAMGTPERKAETGRMFAAQLAACGNVAVIGESVGPYPIEHADEAVQRAVTKALAGDE